MKNISLRVLMLQVRIIHISDPHFTDSSRTLDTGYWIDSQNSQLRSDVIANYLINNKSQLQSSIVVITGDLTDSGDDGDYLYYAKPFIDKLTANGFQVYSIPGNHDYCIEGNLSFEATRFLRKDNADNNGRRQRFIQYITGYSKYPQFIDSTYWRLILLDSMQGELDENNWMNPDSDKWAQGKIGKDQWSDMVTLINDYQKYRKTGNRLVVALHHSPLQSIADSSTGGFNRADDFIKICTDNVDCILFGHTSATGVLQQGFPDAESTDIIPMINCENLEHMSWSGERKFDGDSALGMCVGQDADGRLEIFYIGTDLGVRHNYQTAAGHWDQKFPDGQWAGEEGLGGGGLSICVGQNADGRLEIFYIGTNRGIYHNWQTDTGWSGENRLCGWLDTALQICVGRNAAGWLELFYIGTNAGIYHNRQINTGWAGEERLCGWLDSALQICVGQNADGRLELFYIGTNGGIYHNQQNAPNGGWAGEERLCGWLDTAIQICVGQNNDTRLELFYIGTNGGLYHNYQIAPNGDWAGEERLGSMTDTARQICVGKNKDGRLELFYIGTNQNIYHNCQTLPDAAYPITVVDLGTGQSEVYLTDSPFPQ